VNKIIQSLRNAIVGKLIIGTATMPAFAAGSVSIDIPINVNKLLLKSIDVQASRNIQFKVEFVESPTDTMVRYDSGKVGYRLLDVLDYAYIDKINQTQLHMRITNYDTSGSLTAFTIEVRGLELN
jgi:hypothetical protein